MEESTSATGSPNKTIIILLLVIVLLLAGIVVYFVVNGNKATPNTGNTPTTGTSTGSGTGMGTGTGTGTTTTTPFDPKKATKVPSGETPEQYVKAYFDALVKGDYQTAYDRLPADKKAAQTEASFAEQLKGYGVTSYKIDSAEVGKTEAKITATASMSGGAFSYLWTFVKEGSGWVVKSRTLPGMSQ